MAFPVSAERRIPITDDYMFSYVMRQPGICASVIECLLPGIHIDHVSFLDEPEVQTQKTIQGALGTHSVRLDVYLDDGTTVFNVEMQTGDRSDLPKRLRFYGSRIDCDQLKTSADYSQLRPTYIIFICTFDPFGLDQYHYSFENCCAEVPGLKLNDGSYKLFFNTTGHKGEVSDELRSLLAYFDGNAEIVAEPDTPLIQKIDTIVDVANRDAEWRRSYMTFEMAQLDAMKLGRAEGRSEGIDLISRLFDALMAAGRMDDFSAAMKDEAVRERLLKEFRLA